jgi:YtxH-like protein
MTDYERFGDYRPSERSTVGTAVTFLCIGLGVGSLIALLLAPQSGRKTRNMLRRRYDDWAENAKERVRPLGRAFKK